MRPLVLLFLIIAPVFGDNPACYFNNLIQATGSAGLDTVRCQVRDQGSTSTPYTCNIYLDDASMTSTTDVLTTPSDTSTGVITIPNGVWGTGTINPKDGSQHTFYAYMNSASHGAVTCTTGNGWPYKFSPGSAVDDFLYALYTAAARGATPSTLAVIVNTSDTYSVGSGGNLVCMVNGNSIMDTGVAGIYIAKNGIPCNHVHVLPMAVTGTITKAAMDTAYAALTPALDPSEQFEALAWMRPFRVSGFVATGLSGTVTPGNVMNSITAYFAYNVGTDFISQSADGTTLTQGQANTANGMFRSANTTPFTTYGQRPAMMLAYAACTSGCGTFMTGTWTESITNATTAINASFAANGTNPTGGKIVITSVADFNISGNYRNTSPLAYGTNTGIAPASLNVVTSTNAVAATFSTTGILGYSFSANSVNTAATPAFQSGTGYGAATTSNTGILDGSAGQTPAVYWLNQGAAFSAGLVQEPYGILPQKYPDMSLMMSAYTRGASAIEAAWRSTRDPSTTVFVGDPLNHSFSSSGVQGGSAFSGTIGGNASIQ